MDTKNGLSYRQTVVVAIVSAVLSGSGVPYILSSLGVNPYRSDPFTGSQGRLFDRRLVALEAHVTNHPDVALRAAIAELNSKAAAAESERDLILKNQDRILDRLDRLD